MACAVAFLLATLFHRSRVAVAALVVALGAWGFAAGWPMPVVATAVALALGVLAPMPDRGIASSGALAQWLGAGAVLGMGAMVAGGGSPDVAALLTLDPVGPGSRFGLPTAQLIVYGAAFILIGFALARRRGPVERAFLWTLLLLVVGLHPATGGGAAPLYFLAAGLTLAMSVLETSYAMAYRDELTGLPGRRALVRDLEALGSTYALAMVDVDHFKKFNDRHGHDVGDQVLRMVAARLARAPGGARAYRYGGEEFTLLLPGRTREDAMELLEQVRRAVEQASFSLRSWPRPRKKPEGARRKKSAPDRRRLSVTVSIGVAESKGDPEGWHAVLARADKALYRAKRAGRNRVAK